MANDVTDAMADVADYGVDALDPENLIAAFLDNGERAAKLVQTLKAYGWTFVAARPLPEGMKTTEEKRARWRRIMIGTPLEGGKVHCLVDDIDTLLAELDRLRARLAEAEAAAREMVARWMIERSYATGHGDTLADLLGELAWQTEEQRDRMLAAEAEKAAVVESAAVLARAFEERVAARVAAEREEIIALCLERETIFDNRTGVPIGDCPKYEDGKEIAAAIRARAALAKEEGGE